VLNLFERFAISASTSETVIASAMDFFGGLVDLMAIFPMRDWNSADEIRLAVALDSWQPTRGTQLTGQRNRGPRSIFANNTLERSDVRCGCFPEPFGTQEVVPLSFSETILIPAMFVLPTSAFS
jgi:hypothetical protein